MLRGVLAAGLACLTALMMSGRANASGLLIADGGFGGVLEIKEHDVKVTIDNAIAVTRVKQVFHNTEKRQVEALYTFPVPKGASVANFSMWINGKEMVGEVIEKKRAREIYNSYKRKRRDPGLLEQVDYKTFEMRIFPIPAGADQRVEIAYYQELEFDHDWATYVYPLATVTQKGIDQRVDGKFAIDVELKSAVPIVETESPSHPDQFVFADHSDSYVQASLETPEGSLARDVVLSFHLSRPRTGIDIVTSKGSKEDGYFLLTLTAGQDLAQLDKGMDYVFVLDISGSMANDGKLLISKESVSAFINELSEEDRFEVMAFNLEPTTGFGSLLNANQAARDKASEFLLSQRAKGGTVLKPALDVAYRYRDADRPLNIVILSDGMTEQRERVQLLRLISSRPAGARVFCIGVGNEVNRPLLSQMANDSGGLASFISRGDNFKRQAKAFRGKLMRPAVSNPSIDFGSARVYDVEPRTLPNLYHGMPIRIYGRYKKGGDTKVTVKGEVQGIAFRSQAAVDLPAEEAGNPELERMWAWKRVDRLQKDADRGGSRSSVLDEIIQLGEDYSIVTEYTSFLVLENDAEYRRWKIKRRNAARIGRDREAMERRRIKLDAIRNEASTDIGPVAPLEQSPGPREQQLAGRTPKHNSVNVPVSPAPARQGNRNVGFDLDIGTGPVGPLFILLAGWMARRKKKALKADNA